MFHLYSFTGSRRSRRSKGRAGKLQIYPNNIFFLIKLNFPQIETQGLPGEKGQKGDLGNPGIDVIQAVKVNIWFSIYVYIIKK